MIPWNRTCRTREHRGFPAPPPHLSTAMQEAWRRPYRAAGGRVELFLGREADTSPAGQVWLIYQTLSPSFLPSYRCGWLGTGRRAGNVAWGFLVMRWGLDSAPEVA